MSSGSHVVTSGWTDMTKLMAAFATLGTRIKITNFGIFFWYTDLYFRTTNMLLVGLPQWFQQFHFLIPIIIHGIRRLV